LAISEHDLAWALSQKTERTTESRLKTAGSIAAAARSGRLCTPTPCHATCGGVLEGPLTQSRLASADFHPHLLSRDSLASDTWDDAGSAAAPQSVWI
jgi:hypothetical protein